MEFIRFIAILLFCFILWAIACIVTVYLYVKLPLVLGGIVALYGGYLVIRGNYE